MINQVLWPRKTLDTQLEGPVSSVSPVQPAWAKLLQHAQCLSYAPLSVLQMGSDYVEVDSLHAVGDVCCAAPAVLKPLGPAGHSRHTTENCQ